MKVRYLIQMKGINGQYAFFETKKEKELDDCGYIQVWTQNF